MGTKFIKIDVELVRGSYFNCTYHPVDEVTYATFYLREDAVDGESSLYCRTIPTYKLIFLSRENWIPYYIKRDRYNPTESGGGLCIDTGQGIKIAMYHGDHTWTYIPSSVGRIGENASILKATPIYFKAQWDSDDNNYGGTNYAKIEILQSIELFKRKCNSNNQAGGIVSVESSKANTSGDGVYWNYDGNVIFTAIANDGYSFVGFFNSDGSLFSGDSRVEITKNDNIDYDLIAKFSAKYTVQFDANGGEGIMPSQEFVYGEKENLALNTFTREGYVFVGWNTSPDGLGENIENGADGSTLSSEGGGKVILYAQWRLPNVTIVKENVNDVGDLMDGVGRIELYSSKNSFVSPVFVGYDNKIYYEAQVGEKVRILGVLGENDIIWKVLGVKYGNKYFSEYEFEKLEGNIEIIYYFAKKSFYSISFDCSPEGNAAVVTSPIQPDEDGKYVEGRAITVTGVPALGYKLKAANVFNTDTNLPIGDFDNIENNTFTIDKISSNLRIVCVFVKVDYSIGIGVDEKSADVISDVTAMMGNTYVVTATYGDEVTFEAEVADGYSFGGWYDGEVLVSADNPYKHTVVGDINLVAKAKVAVSLGISYDDNREDTTPIEETCSLAINGETVEVPHKFDVILGESFSYTLTLGSLTAGGENWKFDAWYSGNTKLQYRKDDTVTPTAALSMTANVTSAPIQRTLSISFVNEENGPKIDVGEDAVKISPEPVEKKVEGSVISFTIDGTQEVQLVFTDEIQSAELLAFSKVVIGEDEISDPIFNYFVNDDISATAYYGSLGKRTTSIDFADASDRTMGEITIDGKSSEDMPTPIVTTKDRGEIIELTARPKNGYKFIGWYIIVDGIGDPYLKDASISLKVTTNRTLFAKFVQDPSAVYEWEGSSENKMMTWRSKTYEASKPFNPSACRVDTTGYPVASLSIEMFSAPDSAPTAVANLTNVKSQNARRLPIRRMERYMQVAVSNDEEVDIILVGTSMGGLAI